MLDFYLKLGYTTIVDLTCSTITPFHIKRLSSNTHDVEGLRIRKVEPTDAAKLFALRAAEFSRYHGYHEWTLEQYTKQIEDNQKVDQANGRSTWLLVENKDATPIGYMILHDTVPHAAVEIVAPSKEAAMEFLNYHYNMVKEQMMNGNKVEALLWAMPSSSDTYYQVRSLVSLSTTSHSWYSGAWQAKVTAGRWSSLLENLWPTSSADTPATDLTIVAKDDSKSSTTYRIGSKEQQEVAQVALSEASFMKLLWGYTSPRGFSGTVPDLMQAKNIQRLLNAITEGERAECWITGRDHI